MLHCNTYICCTFDFAFFLQRHPFFAQFILHGNNYATHIHLRFRFGTARRCVLLNHPANMFAMFADDELRHCAWTHPGKKAGKTSYKAGNSRTSLLQHIIVATAATAAVVERHPKIATQPQSAIAKKVTGSGLDVQRRLRQRYWEIWVGLQKNDDWSMIKW